MIYSNDSFIQIKTNLSIFFSCILERYLSHSLFKFFAGLAKSEAIEQLLSYYRLIPTLAFELLPFRCGIDFILFENSIIVSVTGDSITLKFCSVTIFKGSPVEIKSLPLCFQNILSPYNLIFPLFNEVFSIITVTIINESKLAFFLYCIF